MNHKNGKSMTTTNDFTDKLNKYICMKGVTVYSGQKQGSRFSS